jgi:hypothetical protein
MRLSLMKNVFALALLVVFASTVLCTAVQANVAGSLPDIFVSVLAEVKAKTRVRVLFPTELSRPFSDAKHARVDKATADEYAVSLYYELDAGNAGFAASFEATNNPHYSPRDLGNVREVMLTAGITGFFRPVSCGGACAPANLWWEKGGVLYEIRLKLPSTLREKNQQGIIAAVANSAILAGPR